jgi:hypothetical protein
VGTWGLTTTGEWPGAICEREKNAQRVSVGCALLLTRQCFQRRAAGSSPGVCGGGGHVLPRHLSQCDWRSPCAGAAGGAQRLEGDEQRGSGDTRLERRARWRTLARMRRCLNSCPPPPVSRRMVGPIAQFDAHHSLSSPLFIIRLPIARPSHRPSRRPIIPGVRRRRDGPHRRGQAAHQRR